jgi:hypothetical protein
MVLEHEEVKNTFFVLKKTLHINHICLGRGPGLSFKFSKKNKKFNTNETRKHKLPSLDFFCNASSKKLTKTFSIHLCLIFNSWEKNKNTFLLLEKKQQHFFGSIK